ncbi:mandelate racemase/muconate lactonizing enzyme family protein [Spiractinospora alimapuensis]|uniref:mandelate racemase/muconate lactonizing enzyme family protein n=1 Tax=Spiractinospora alimapuensis TaxID=2820884 RepID=UPI001F348040|nr:mandelate racemase/muconate lactonizing enzyme family protein [Spiractinospora alimapuensis]QVQ50637.1 mandelate racemase/muconate lactonizing enzyme family protein [Spiractinospora alimapuensis]
MRITAVRATPIAVPLRVPEVWAFGRRTGQISVLVEVDTDEGVTGIGEAAAYPSVDVVLAALRGLEPLVVGEDPMAVERLTKRVEVVGTWHHMRNQSPALAAVDMACWDIVGKVCSQPLSTLFGGVFHDTVEFFYYVTGAEPDQLRQMAEEGTKAGFSTFYLKVGAPDPREDLERVAAVRDGAGAAGRIRVDANEAWSPAAAIRILREMEPFGLEFAEQPVSGRNLTEMAYVRSRVDTPLLANEASWTRFDQMETVRHAAADAISVDNQMDGGLMNLKRSAGICEAAGLGVVKHSLGELGVALTASLHVLSTTPNFIYANQGYASILADDILAEPYEHRDGRLAPPSGPGLGVSLDREKVGRYAEDYARDPAAFAFTSRATGAAHLPRL